MMFHDLWPFHSQGSSNWSSWDRRKADRIFHASAILAYSWMHCIQFVLSCQFTNILVTGCSFLLILLLTFFPRVVCLKLAKSHALNSYRTYSPLPWGVTRRYSCLCKSLDTAHDVNFLHKKSSLIQELRILDQYWIMPHPEIHCSQCTVSVLLFVTNCSCPLCPEWLSTRLYINLSTSVKWMSHCHGNIISVQKEWKLFTHNKSASYYCATAMLRTGSSKVFPKVLI